MKKKYIVMCTIPFGYDDTYFCEYSGIEHDNKKEAVKESNEAIHDKNVISVSIYEVYRD